MEYIFVEDVANLFAILRSTETTSVQIVYTSLVTYCLYCTDSTLVMAHIVFTEMSICTCHTHTHTHTHTNISLTHFLLLLLIINRHWLTVCWAGRPTKKLLQYGSINYTPKRKHRNIWWPLSFQNSCTLQQSLSSNTPLHT